MVQDEAQGDRFVLGPRQRLAEGGHLPGGNVGQVALPCAERVGRRAAPEKLGQGGFISLQDTNKGGDTYCSKGRWCYSFIRYTMDGTQALLMAINMNPQNTYKAFVIVPQDVLDTVGLSGATKVILTDRLDAATELTVDVAKLTTTGVQIPLSPSQTRILTMKAG